MIPLEKQVCNLELAKRLQELKFRQDSLYFWVETPEGTFIVYVPENRLHSYPTSKTHSAFTVAELGEMLPDQVSSWRTGIEWICSHDELSVTGEAVPEQRADTEADARAKMLIYLVENKLTNI